MIEGDAELLAFGSIADVHDRGFVKTTAKAGEGGALAILRPTGSCSVTVSAEGMEPVRVSF